VDWVSKSSGGEIFVLRNSQFLMLTLAGSTTRAQHTLQFWAFTAPLKAFGYSSGIRRMDLILEAGDHPALYLTNSRGHCGVLLDFRDKIQSLSPREAEHVEIILLSKTAFVDVTDLFDRTVFELRFPERHATVWLKTFKYKEFRQEPLERCVANVMWVRWKNGVAERIAIGAVHEDAWAAAQGKHKLINLVRS
jgi:hypothetical protein